MMNYLISDFVLRFTCGMCTECCRLPWKIRLDAGLMKKYDRLAEEDENFRRAYAAGITKKKDGTGEFKRVGYVALSTEKNGKLQGKFGEGSCPFLTGKVCAIQKHYGVEYQPETCRKYPRAISITPRGMEVAISFSCPRAAEMLKQKEPLGFHYNPAGFALEGTKNLPAAYIGDRVRMAKRGKANYFRVEETLIDIMQTRDLPFRSRLALTGLVLDKIKDGDEAGAQKLLDNIDAQMVGGLMSMPGNMDFQFKLAGELLEYRRDMGIKGENMKRLLDLAYNKLALFEGRPGITGGMRRFVDGYRRRYRPWEDEVGHVLENYFVNFIFTKIFYSFKYMDAYFLMIMQHTLLRFLAVCSCMGGQKNLDEDILIDVINAVERNIMHSREYLGKALEGARKSGLNKLPYYISLINI